MVGHLDGGLGRAVEVVQFRAGEFAQLVRGLGGERLAGGEDHAQAGAPRGGLLGDEHGHHRRHEVGDRDAFAGNEFGEVDRVAVAIGPGDHQARADLQGQEELRHRHVEGGGGLLEQHVGGGQVVAGAHPGEPVDDGGMGHRHALGAAGRTRGEDDVGGAGIPQRRNAVRVGQRGVVVTGQVQQVDAHLRGVQQQVGAGGQHGHRVGGLEDVFDAVGRVVGIQRQVSGTCRGHGVHADDQVQGAAHTQGDEGIRADTLTDQPAGEPPHAGGELGVGQTRPLEGERDGVGGAGHLGLEQLGQRLRDAVQGGGHIEGGVVPTPHDQFAFGRAQQVDVADRYRGVGGHGGKHAPEALGERGGGGGVEHLGGVAQIAGEPLAGLADHQVQVEFHGGVVDLDRGDAQTGQLEGAGLAHPGGIGERQHDLGQRRRAGGAVHRQGVDDAFEGHLGIGEGGQVGGADAIEQIGEGPVGADLGAQHQGVDEHADQGVELAFAAAADRGGDGDVGGVRAAGQQGGEGGVHDHEHGDAVRAGQFTQSGGHRRIHRERHGRTGIGGYRGPRAVGGQGELRGQARQGLAPERELLVCHGARLVRVAEQFVLPEAVVRVLDVQGFPAGLRADGAGGVCAHQIQDQRLQRQGVRGDVVHDHGQHVFGLGGVLVDHEKTDARGKFTGHVKPRSGEGRDRCQQFGRGDRHRVEAQPDLGDIQNVLVGTGFRVRVAGPQGFVAGQHIQGGLFERRDVERAAQAQHDRQVVDALFAVLGFDPVEEP
ncbi:hypothetical protein NS07_v2contig00080-0004 [Nocardia seriolae]|nr:hypothetical protein NS07_v2contig00080-0004 [Nocardia seriolae]